MKKKDSKLKLCLNFSLKHKYNATNPPVIAHVLVPPSACKTSQSTFIVFSPIALEFNAVLKDLPISLYISIVLPIVYQTASLFAG